MTVRDDLEAILNEGVSSDIFLADQAFALYACIGEHAAGVNASTYSDVLSTMQRGALSEFVLAVTRLYDVPRQYPLRNIPGALSFIEEHAQELKIEQPIVLRRDMQRLRVWCPEMDGPDAAEIVRAVCRSLRARVPRVATSRALDALRALRDKRIAHHEQLTSELQRTTWDAAQSLLHPAKDIVGVVGMAFVSTVFTDDEGRYMMDSDAQRSASQLRRIFGRLEIPQNPPPVGA